MRVDPWGWECGRQRRDSIPTLRACCTLRTCTAQPRAVAQEQKCSKIRHDSPIHGLLHDKKHAKSTGLVFSESVQCRHRGAMNDGCGMWNQKGDEIPKIVPCLTILGLLYREYNFFGHIHPVTTTVELLKRAQQLVTFAGRDLPPTDFQSWSGGPPRLSPPVASGLAGV